MKKLGVFLSIFFLFGLSAFAQTKPDYSGEWALDKEKMQSAANFNVESMTIKAVQSAGEIKLNTATKYPVQADEASGDGGQTKRVRQPIGESATVYTLDGKETVVEVESPAGKMPLKLQASFESDGKLNLNSTRTIKTPNGESTVVIKEVWELADGGKTLKITREVKAQNNVRKASMVFTKK